jgi:hypothetical protein
LKEEKIMVPVAADFEAEAGEKDEGEPDQRQTRPLAARRPAAGGRPSERQADERDEVDEDPSYSTRLSR